MSAGPSPAPACVSGHGRARSEAVWRLQQPLRRLGAGDSYSEETNERRELIRWLHK